MTCSVGLMSQVSQNRTSLCLPATPIFQMHSSCLSERITAPKLSERSINKKVYYSFQEREVLKESTHVSVQREQLFGVTDHVNIHMYFTHSHSLTFHLRACGHPAVCSQYRSERCPVSRHGNCDSLFNVWIPCLLQLCAAAANFGDEARRKRDDGDINLRISLCLHWLTITE